MSPPIRDGAGNDIGAIRLGDGTEISEVRTGAGDVLFSAIPDSVVSRPADNNSGSASGRLGTIISTQVEWPEIQARISSNSSGFSTAHVEKLDSNNNVLSTIASVGISNLSAGDVVTFDESDLSENLTPSNDYAIVFDSGATSGNLTAASFPFTSPDGDLSMINGFNSGSAQGDALSFNEIGNINL